MCGASLLLCLEVSHSEGILKVIARTQLSSACKLKFCFLTGPSTCTCKTKPCKCKPSKGLHVSLGEDYIASSLWGNPGQCSKCI